MITIMAVIVNLLCKPQEQNSATVILKLTSVDRTKVQTKTKTLTETKVVKTIVKVYVCGPRSP